MADRDDLERLFLENRHLIARITAAAGRRRGLHGADLEGFASWTVARLAERDYEVLARFRGTCSLTAYLVTVVWMLSREYRASN